MRARVHVWCAAIWLTACAAEDGSKPKNDPDLAMNRIDTSLRVLPVEGEYEGRTLEQWAVEYMRWYYSWTADMCLSPENDPNGSRCALHQPTDSPVFYMASSNYSREDSLITRSECQVPQGKALLVPIAFFADDDATTGEERSPAQISDNVQTVKESMRDLVFATDSRAIKVSTAHAVGPVAFEYSVKSTPNWHSCNDVAGVENTKVEPSYVAGYFALIAPPVSGEHELEFGGVYTYLDRDFHRHVDTRFLVAYP